MAPSRRCPDHPDNRVKDCSAVSDAVNLNDVAFGARWPNGPSIARAFAAIRPSITISAAAGTQIVLPTHFTTSSAIPPRAPAISSSSKPSGTTACDASNVAGLVPMTMAISRSSPSFSTSSKKAKVWRGSRSAPSSLGPETCNRWIETF